MLENITIILICMIATGSIFYGGYVVGKTSHKNKVDKNIYADDDWNNGWSTGWKSGYKTGLIQGESSGYNKGYKDGYMTAFWDSRFDDYN